MQITRLLTIFCVSDATVFNPSRTFRGERPFTAFLIEYRFSTTPSIGPVILALSFPLRVALTPASEGFVFVRDPVADFLTQGADSMAWNIRGQGREVG